MEFQDRASIQTFDMRGNDDPFLYRLLEGEEDAPQVERRRSQQDVMDVDVNVDANTNQEEQEQEQEQQMQEQEQELLPDLHSVCGECSLPLPLPLAEQEEQEILVRDVSSPLPHHSSLPLLLQPLTLTPVRDHHQQYQAVAPTDVAPAHNFDGNSTEYEQQQQNLSPTSCYHNHYPPPEVHHTYSPPYPHHHNHHPYPPAFHHHHHHPPPPHYPFPPPPPPLTVQPERHQTPLQGGADGNQRQQKQQSVSITSGDKTNIANATNCNHFKNSQEAAAPHAHISPPTPSPLHPSQYVPLPPPPPPPHCHYYDHYIPYYPHAHPNAYPPPPPPYYGVPYPHHDHQHHEQQQEQQCIQQPTEIPEMTTLTTDNDSTVFKNNAVETATVGKGSSCGSGSSNDNDCSSKQRLLVVEEENKKTENVYCSCGTSIENHHHHHHHGSSNLPFAPTQIQQQQGRKHNEITLQSQENESDLKKQMDDITFNDEQDITLQEKELYDNYFYHNHNNSSNKNHNNNSQQQQQQQQQQDNRNLRNRIHNREEKVEVERIRSEPEWERTGEEDDFLRDYTIAKKKKNESEWESRRCDQLEMDGYCVDVGIDVDAKGAVERVKGGIGIGNVTGTVAAIESEVGAGEVAVVSAASSSTSSSESQFSTGVVQNDSSIPTPVITEKSLFLSKDGSETSSHQRRFIINGTHTAERNISIGNKEQLEPHWQKKSEEIQKKDKDMKDQMKFLALKNVEEKTEEVKRDFTPFEEQRRKKNERSRKRTRDKKREMERILAIAEESRTEDEKNWLDVNLNAKKRKNESDRLRREKLRKEVECAKDNDNMPSKEKMLCLEKEKRRLERVKVWRNKEREHREKIKKIALKRDEEKTEEEIQLLRLFEEKRRRKNLCSRESARKREGEIKRLLSLPKEDLTDSEKQWLDVHWKAKTKKIEGDRERRRRIKMTQTFPK